MSAVARSRAERRHHRERVIAARQRFLRFVRAWGSDPRLDVEPGRYADRHPADCGNPGCGLCHIGKRHPGQRRAHDERAARRYEQGAG